MAFPPADSTTISPTAPGPDRGAERPVTRPAPRARTARGTLPETIPEAGRPAGPAAGLEAGPPDRPGRRTGPARSERTGTGRPSGPRRSAPRSAGPRPSAVPTGLALDPAAVANVAGLAEEVALLRASIRRLARHDDAAEQVKVLAELRHQVEALCTALRTQQALAGHDGDTRAAELARALDALGDELGVPR